jgi:hypothetical protein
LASNGVYFENSILMSTSLESQAIPMSVNTGVKFGFGHTEK